jgi:hypothetical protein
MIQVCAPPRAVNTSSQPTKASEGSIATLLDNNFSPLGYLVWGLIWVLFSFLGLGIWEFSVGQASSFSIHVFYLTSAAAFDSQIPRFASYKHSPFCY